MSGVGNIYADEALWRAKIHPETSTADLSTKKVNLLRVSIATDAFSVIRGFLIILFIT
jgi:formamidopyrimidine-DNA glycosylase